MNPALFSDDLPRGAHRLLWWLIAHQDVDDKGVATGVCGKGWRERARAELGVSKPTLWRMEGYLRRAGITECNTFSRMIRVRAETFN